MKTTITLLLALLFSLPKAHACFAYGTPVQTPEGLKAIEKFMLGDSLTTYSASGEAKVSNIQFSSGTGPDGMQPAMVYLNFDNQKNLITSMDQLFVLSNGKLIQASKIIPGTEIKTQDGKSSKVTQISLGPYQGGIHAIAGLRQWSGSLDDHILNANGFLVGDYILQIYFEQIDDSDKSEGPVLKHPFYKEYQR